MPNRRLQVGSGLPQVGLETTARPIDTFEHPKAEQGMAKLAAGLSELAPALSRYSGHLAEKNNKKDLAAGIKKARELQEQNISYRKAIKDGLLPANQSPFFMAGLREQFGRISADKWESDLRVAIAKDEKLQDTDNIEDFDAFVADHRNRWMEKNVGGENRDRHFDIGFGDRADAYYANSRRQFSAELAERVVNQSNEAHFAEVKKSVEFEWYSGARPQDIAASLQRLNDDLYNQGRGGRQLNLTTVRAVIAAAEKNNDLSILSVLDHVRGGPQGSLLADTSYGSPLILEAKRRIASEVQAQMNRDRDNTVHEKREGVEALYAELDELLEKAPDPSSVDLKEWTARMREIDPTSVPVLYGLRESYTTRNGAGDPEITGQAWEEFWKGTLTKQRVFELRGSGDISLSTFNSLQEQFDLRARRNESGPPSSGDWLNDRLLNNLRQMTRNRFTTEYGSSSQDARDRATRGEQEAIAQYLIWRAKNPTSTPAEEATFINTVVDDAFQKFGEATDVRKYGQLPEVTPLFSGPQPPDWTKVRLADDNLLNQMEQEIRDRYLMRRSSLSDTVVSVLQQADLDLSNPKALDDFFRVQRSLPAKNR
jgi:hypothetical protein